MRAILPLAATAAFSLALAMPAAAAVVINVGPGALQPDENLLFNNNPNPGNTLQGSTNQTGTSITATGGEMLAASGGQARLDAMDSLISSTFTFNGLTNQLVGFDLADDGLAFTSAEFRLFGGSATEATLTFVDTNGQVSTRSMAIPASGFFSAETVDGQPIDYFSIAANGTIGDVRQVRLGGLLPLAIIPEPAVWSMMILGFGGVGALLRQRRAISA